MSEDIKVGETYNVRVKVAEKKDDKIITCVVSDNGLPLEDVSTIFFRNEALAFSPVLDPAPIAFFKSTVIPEAYPKYDPCRTFKKGDRVRVVKWSGRNPVLPFMDCKVGDIGTVIKDEDPTSFFVRIHLEGKYEKDMPYCHLELVTPVEEVKPYFVAYDDRFYHVHKKGEDAALAVYSEARHPHAKAAAEAECDSLNDEWRKEQKETEHGRMDYIDKHCHNCKHFHFQNVYNAWCDYHNEGITTDSQACLCWELRKEQSNDR
jgi:hypothetical protein